MTAIGEKNIQVHVVVKIHVHRPNIGPACYTCMLTFAVMALWLVNLEVINSRATSLIIAINTFTSRNFKTIQLSL